MTYESLVKTSSCVCFVGYRLSTVHSRFELLLGHREFVFSTESPTAETRKSHRQITWHRL